RQAAQLGVNLRQQGRCGLLFDRRVFRARRFRHRANSSGAGRAKKSAEILTLVPSHSQMVRQGRQANFAVDSAERSGLRGASVRGRPFPNRLPPGESRPFCALTYGGAPMSLRRFQTWLRDLSRTPSRGKRRPRRLVLEELEIRLAPAAQKLVFLD